MNRQEQAGSLTGDVGGIMMVIDTGFHDGPRTSGTKVPICDRRPKRTTSVRPHFNRTRYQERWSTISEITMVEKSINRRTILKATGLSAALVSAPVRAVQTASLAGLPVKRLKLLVLGGTRYLGPAVVRSALARGHELTLFNRGKTQANLFPGLSRRLGNRFPERDTGLSALDSGEWDAVLDLCGQYPRIVEASAKLLAGRVGRYLFVSSISVYRNYQLVGLDEQAEVRPVPETYEEFPDLVENDWATYGGRKVGSENAVSRLFGDRATIVRPCSICGGENNDGSGAYWASRLYRDERVLLPGNGSDPTQLIDVDDLADFIVLSVERDLGGAYNLVGPAERLTFGDYIAEAARVVNSRARQVWGG
jgi:2'-hydroxyisoflavone reductase